MADDVLNPAPRLSPGRFTFAFITLTLTSGITIGMNKVLVTLLALRLDAQPWQMGLLISAESLSMMLMSLPAGLLISRYGAGRVYGVASVFAMLLYPLVASAGVWYVAALWLFIAGVCIPYRVVAMGSSWLERLPEIGTRRAGWYKGTLTLGIALVGPLLGSLAVENLDVRRGYWITSGLFAFMAVFGYAILSHRRSSASRTQSVRSNLLSMLGQLKHPVVRQVCLFDGMAGMVRGFFGTFVIVIAVRVLGWTEARGVLVMVLEGSIYVAVLLVIGPLAFRLGQDRLYDLGHTTLIAGLLVLGLTPNGVGLLIGAVLHALGQGFNHILNIARISELEGDKGHVSGLQTMVGMGGGFAGAAVGGLLSQGVALQHVFLLWIPLWLAVCPTTWRMLGQTRAMLGARK